MQYHVLYSRFFFLIFELLCKILLRKEYRICYPVDEFLMWTFIIKTFPRRVNSIESIMYLQYYCSLIFMNCDTMIHCLLRYCLNILVTIIYSTFILDFLITRNSWYFFGYPESIIDMNTVDNQTNCLYTAMESYHNWQYLNQYIRFDTRENTAVLEQYHDTANSLI